MATGVVLNWNNQAINFDYGFAMGIQKDFTRADDGTILNEKHTLTIKGSFVATGSAATDRYANLLTQMYSKVSYVEQGAAGRQVSIQAGRLTITNNSTPIVDYLSANLIGISVPEPSEDTAGIQFQEVTFTFETFNTPNDPALSYWKLRSASENFDFKKDEDRIFYDGSAIDQESALKYGFTVTHTVSAQGMFDYNTKSEAINEAYRYVNDRVTKIGDALLTVNTDIYGRGFLGTSSLDPKNWKVGGTSSDVVSTEISSYNLYNKIRSSSADATAGSYSVTTTYFLSKELATIDVNANFNRDESGESSVTVEGTIQGVSTQDVKSVTHDKLGNARTVYNTLSGNKSLRTGCPIYTLANNTFSNYHPDISYVALRDYPMATTVGESKTAGSISFNVTYRGYPNEFKTFLDGITGAIAANITINDVNRNGAGYDMQTIVVVPIPGRTKGPILQDMNTTKERKRTAVIDVVVDASQRKSTNDTLRSTVISKANAYKPSSGDVYVENFQEAWDWVTGKYTATLDWIYQP
jgi:hypothetical protein